MEAPPFAFDVLELAGDDLRALPWVRRTELLRETFPGGGRLRLAQTPLASRAAHDQLVAVGFEGSVLKRSGSTYRPGRQTGLRKHKASHRATATLRDVRLDVTGAPVEQRACSSTSLIPVGRSRSWFA